MRRYVDVPVDVVAAMHRQLIEGAALPGDGPLIWSWLTQWMESERANFLQVCLECGFLEDLAQLGPEDTQEAAAVAASASVLHRQAM